MSRRRNPDRSWPKMKTRGARRKQLQQLFELTYDVLVQPMVPTRRVTGWKVYGGVPHGESHTLIGEFPRESFPGLLAQVEGWDPDRWRR